MLLEVVSVAAKRKRLCDGSLTTHVVSAIAVVDARHLSNELIL